MSLDSGLVGGGTSMAAQGSDGAWPQEAAGMAAEGSAEPGVDAAFKLQVEVGATVSATFPFFGDPSGGQLSFQIGDNIQVLQKDELWSWGKLERTGDEGWFPHNYVQAAFQPLPGMHELKQRVLIKKAREEAIARGEDPDLAEAAILNGGVAPAVISQPEPEPTPAPAPTVGAGLNLSAQGWDFDSLGMGISAAPAPAPVEQPAPQAEDLNNGAAWSNQQGGDADMFGMWMDDLGEDRSSDADDTLSIASATSSDRERRRRERKNIARELLDTEDKYVKMLEALLATIIRPCLGQGTNKSTPLAKEEANELFGTLRAEEILAINTAFREQLRGRMATLSDETCFGDLFKRFAPFLKMYVEYCTQHENTASRISLIAAKNDKFSNLLHRARSDPRCQDLDAQSLLIMPIQRIPRYKLLLEGMLKNTEKEHPDRPLLQSAIEQISDVASFINDSIKRRENQAKIWDLQAMLTEPIDLATPTRIFIRSGVLTKLGRRYQDREDFFALFNDGLLHAKPATFGTKYVFKRIDPVLQVENVGFLKDKPKALHAFRVVTKGHIYLLCARSEALKQDWVKVLDLAIRSGKRELIHKGPLRVLSLAKEGGVRLAYFYVFNDVVVRGKTLWKGKFKHKETLDVTRIDPNFNLDARQEALLPKELTSRMLHEQTFRVSHKHGNIILIANSDTDKALWLSALEHQQELKRNSQIGTVANNKRIVHEDNFADLEDSRDSRASSSAAGHASSGRDLKPPSASGRNPGSRSMSPSAEQRRRGAAASTFGVGPVEEYLRSSAGASKLSGTRDRRKGEGSPKRTGGPLATTSDLLISLESSDEEEDTSRRAAANNRRSLPRQLHQQQHQQQHSNSMRRIGSEGQVSTRSGGLGGGGRGNLGGQSLLDSDLMAVLSGPGQSGTSSFQSNPAGAPFGSVGNASGSGSSRAIGANGGMRSPSYGPLQGGGHVGFDLGAAGVGAGGAFGNGTMAGGGKSGGLPRSQSHSASTMPLLQPPARDTPPFRSSHLNGSRGGHANGQNHATQQPSGSASGAMVLYGAGGGAQQGMVSQQQQHQQPGPGAMVLHGASQAGGAGMRGSADRGFDQFETAPHGGASRQAQNAHQSFGGPVGGAGVGHAGFGGGVPMQGFGAMNQQSQGSPPQPFSQQMQAGFPQQQYQQPMQSQPQQSQPQQQQHFQQFQQGPVQMQFPQSQQQQPQYHQQPVGGMHQPFQGF